MGTVISANRICSLPLSSYVFDITGEIDGLGDSIKNIPVYFIGAHRSFIGDILACKIPHDVYCDAISFSIVQFLENNNVPPISILRTIIPIKYDTITNYLIHRSSDIANNVRNTMPANRYVCEVGNNKLKIIATD